MNTAIAPMKVVRRRHRKMTHLKDFYGDDGTRTFCGQNIRWPEEGIAVNAAEITCTPCLVEAVSRKGRA